MRKDEPTINNIEEILQEAVNKSFSRNELRNLKNVYVDSMREYFNKAPYSVYRDNAAFDKKYFEGQKEFAASRAREYISKTIDAWHKDSK
jgi:hypothetical protein